jgi:tellurite resistance protein
MNLKMNPGRRVPPNFFGFGFGSAGLCETWRIAQFYGHAPAGVGDALAALSALAWLTVLLTYVGYLITDGLALRQDLADPVVGPFLSLAVITPMLLAVLGLVPYAPEAGKMLFDVLLALTVAFGSWFTGQWICGSVELDKFHPGYFLPVAAGGMLGSDGAALVGQYRLAAVMFGYGALSGIVTASMVLGRLYLRPLLPVPLLPTLGILVAPPAVAALAWLDGHGDHIDAMTTFLGGFSLLMVLAQLRLLPLYRRLPFMPSTWSFAFAWSAVASVGMHWLNDTRPGGYLAEEYILLAANSVLVAAIAARTVVALYRRQLLPQAEATGTADLAGTASPLQDARVPGPGQA